MTSPCIVQPTCRGCMVVVRSTSLRPAPNPIPIPGPIRRRGSIRIQSFSTTRSIFAQPLDSRPIESWYRPPPPLPNNDTQESTSQTQTSNSSSTSTNTSKYSASPSSSSSSSSSSPAPSSSQDTYELFTSSTTIQDPPRTAINFAEKYEPTESDFLNPSTSSSSSTSTRSTKRISSSPPTTTTIATATAGWGMYEEYKNRSSSTSNATRRRRRKERSVLPPLPVGEMPPDGQTRFDWRLRSLSRSNMSLGTDKKRGMTLTNGVQDWWTELQLKKRVTAQSSSLEQGDLYYDETKRYSDHFIPLLLLEQDEEKRKFEERLRESGLDKLRREGLALDDMSATPDKRSRFSWGRAQIVRFDKPASQFGDLGYHRFLTSTNVILSRTDPLHNAVLKDGQLAQGSVEHDERMAGKVIFAGRDFIKVQFPVPIPNIEHGEWRIDLGLNDWALQAQLNAIKELNSDPLVQDMEDFVDPTAASSTSGASGRTKLARKREETILRGTALRDKVLRAFQEDYVPYDAPSDLGNATIQSIRDTKPDDVDAVPTPSPHTDPGPSGILAKNQLIHSWTQRYRGDRAGDVLRVEGDPPLSLNQSQMKAIAMMLSERLSLVQGPPGTGKTRVIIETIKLVKHHWQVPFPILVCAHTNVAVDNLLSGLRQNGIKAVRIGQTERVRRDLYKYSLESLLTEHPLWEDIVKLGEDLDALSAKCDEMQQTPIRGHSRLKVMRALISLKKDVQQTLAEKRALVNRLVLNDADVICTTCLSACTTKLRHLDFPMVFLDEASMATEPLSMVPFMKGSSHVAIIGDHKQLPPVIISPEGQAGGLAISLFERLIHERHVPSIMLDTQYRMHPTISSFPSAAFYNSDLKDGTLDSVTGEVKAGWEPPMSIALNEGKSVGFVDHDYPESKVGRSLANEGDVRLVMEIVEDLLSKNPDLQGKHIGIISPYAAQIQRLAEALQAMLVSDGTRARLGFERTSEIAEIEVKTVDGFEGREKEVIVFSTVRSNTSGHIGFLGDWRRLNVGLTRARRGLVVVGNSETLEKAKRGDSMEGVLPSGGGDVWRGFMRWLRANELIKEAEDGEVVSVVEEVVDEADEEYEDLVAARA
ncbi:P-loop containing nucleoside triphosphate hydrolase protein [Naematelia encephala]|uniref:p-loop containing nucleoside triphosphate hydrolase protein n=1 Tax=Naematelia encephala TaxID=71784 RepID=A0A1Y2BDM7_9TREE|nr:P-loop containing nucleoside triphosphate hydrolase protein [Naematelia encephala]